MKTKGRFMPLSKRLQALPWKHQQNSPRITTIAEEVEDIESVTSLAGYEIMTEGRGSNAGTCLINLKPWNERNHSVHEIMEELEHETKDLGAIIEYFEPPAVPGFGSSGGFSLRMLDKTGVKRIIKNLIKSIKSFWLL
jgi:multidrug efflux pump subunit AcrB